MKCLTYRVYLAYIFHQTDKNILEDTEETLKGSLNVVHEFLNCILAFLN